MNNMHNSDLYEDIKAISKNIFILFILVVLLTVYIATTKERNVVRISFYYAATVSTIMITYYDRLKKIIQKHIEDQSIADSIKSIKTIKTFIVVAGWLLIGVSSVVTLTSSGNERYTLYTYLFGGVCLYYLAFYIALSKVLKQIK